MYIRDIEQEKSQRPSQLNSLSDFVSPSTPPSGDFEVRVETVYPVPAFKFPMIKSAAAVLTRGHKRFHESREHTKHTSSLCLILNESEGFLCVFNR